MGSPRMKLLRRAYLACRPSSELRQILNGFDEKEIPSECAIVEQVIRNAVSTKYPASNSYRLKVLKLLISFLESHAELEDHLYDELRAVMTSAIERPSYVSYEVGDEELECVTLIEERAFVTQGSTGFKSWPAAKMLTEVLLNQNLDRKRIVELGAGVGLTGLILLRKCPSIQSYIFTDCHAGVLDTLRQNIDLNLNANDARPQVQLLDWCVGGSIEADLIVGADIVFDKDIVPFLVDLIVRAIHRNSCDAIISSVIRNEETYQLFYETVRKELRCEKLRLSDTRYFEEIPDKYEIIKLSRKP
ncbi:protein-lysine N-methyltransferase EEF2KMT [Galendromus occidentalis]|uniref:Protein-lysine N-methyltransferase EEF2KMT n=1 Tax=Galendromus occidentalis TaxID=34638 RepID=A0AAJ6QXP2_9ACAR|nr:protein-lysine N-methyltransferase EEF2KMT [Galendromus occidentalis]